VTGSIQDQELVLDGKAVIDADVRAGTIHIHGGKWLIAGTTKLEHVRFLFHDEAATIRNFVRMAEYGEA
jgi:hypothetical protein